MSEPVFDDTQSSHHCFVIIFAAPGVPRNPSVRGGVQLGGIWMRRVVVDRADDYASRPRCGRAERGALELSRVVAGFHVFHFSGVSGFDPIWKMIELGEVADRGDPCQFEACPVGCVFYQCCDFAYLVQLALPARARTPAPTLGRARRPSSIILIYLLLLALTGLLSAASSA